MRQVLSTDKHAAISCVILFPRPTGAEPEQLIRQFRTDYKPRIAVTVDMIATGTDVKPLEVLIFMRHPGAAGRCRSEHDPRPGTASGHGSLDTGALLRPVENAVS
jgi:hypothetical protein